MGSDGSVSRLIDGWVVREDDRALQALWERYFDKLVHLAGSQLRGALRGYREDVASIALASFCRGAREGRFPDLLDRDSLWRLLVKITVRKAQRLVRDENRQKRGGAAQILTETTGEDDDVLVWDEVLSHEPDPELAAVAREEYQRLLDRLDDEGLRQVAVWRMEERTVEEIAELLQCAPRTVKRKLELIRKLWASAGEP